MISTGVIGTGYWGKNLVRVFYSLPECRLEYLCDEDESLLAEIGAGCPGVRRTRDYRELLKDKSLQAVAVSTPAASHYKLAREALEAGKHTFVEKPLALDTSEAEELVSLAAERGVVLMVGHLLIYHPAVGVLRRMIEEGELGRIHYIYTQRVNLGMVRRDENALWSLGPHDVSIIIHLVGKDPVEVSARGACYIRREIEDVVFLMLRFEDGEIAHVQLSWLDPHKERQITVVGSQKMVVFDDMQASEKIKVFDKGINVETDYNSYTELLTLREGNLHIPRLRMAEPLAVECRHFLDCVARGTPCRSSGADGLRVVRVLDAASRSLERGGEPVKIR